VSVVLLKEKNKSLQPIYLLWPILIMANRKLCSNNNYIIIICTYYIFDLYKELFTFCYIVIRCSWYVTVLAIIIRYKKTWYFSIGIIDSVTYTQLNFKSNFFLYWKICYVRIIKFRSHGHTGRGQSFISRRIKSIL